MLPLNRCATARHSFSKLLIHKQYMYPHTCKSADTHRHAHQQAPSLLDLLSYLRTLYSFPPSGNLFHVNTASICRVCPLTPHNHLLLRCLSQSPSVKIKRVYIQSTSPLRSLPLQCVCGSQDTAQRLAGSCNTTRCVGKFCIHTVEGLFSKTVLIVISVEGIIKTEHPYSFCIYTEGVVRAAA